MRRHIDATCLKPPIRGSRHPAGGIDGVVPDRAHDPMTWPRQSAPRRALGNRWCLSLILSAFVSAENGMINVRSLLAALVVVLLTSCASLPPQVGRAPTHALTDTQATRLGAAFAPQDQQHPGESAFHLLPDSVDALIARVVLMEIC